MFANCGLPFYLGGEIAERKRLLVATPEMLRSRFLLDVRTQSSVEAINHSTKTVCICDLASGREYEEPYGKLILATAAASVRLPIPGIDLPNVFTLRTLQDTDRIKELTDRDVKQAVLLGAASSVWNGQRLRARRPIPGNVGDRHPRLLRPYSVNDWRFGKSPAAGRTTPPQGMRPPDPSRRVLPGAEAMTLKLLFDPITGKILGAQAVGGADVDKRINVLPVAIQWHDGV